MDEQQPAFAAREGLPGLLRGPLLDRVDLATVAGGRMHPDAFVYDIRVGERSVQVVGTDLPADLRRLADIVLADDR